MPESVVSRTLNVLLRIANHGKWIIGLILIDYLTCTVLYWKLEGEKLNNSIWWAVVTGQTVGYGDYYPETMPGRIIAMFLMVTIGLLWIILGAYITIRLVLDANLFSHDEQERLEAATVRNGIMDGSIPPCSTELPPLNWNPFQHNAVCNCGWTPPSALDRHFRTMLTAAARNN